MAGSSDIPPNSRLFVLCPQSMTEADMRNAFDPYGRIDDCWVVHDRNTGKSKGVCYIKFSKASEACRAMEEMDNKQMGNEPRPIKVKMSTPVGVGNKRETELECFERLRCAFVRVPSKMACDGKPYTDESIKSEFSKFGNVVNCHMTKSRRNCYVTFEKASQAATAIEQCDKDFSAVFVDPEKSSLLRKRSPDRGSQRSFSPEEQYRRPGLIGPPKTPQPAYPPSAPVPSPYGKAPILATPGQRNGNGYYDSVHQGVNPASAPVAGVEDFVQGPSSLSNNPTRCREIYMKINYPLSRENAYRLCNLVPGLDTLEWVKTTGENAQLHTIFLVRYASPASASWAWEKLQDLEYPPGSYVRVRYADAGFPRDWDLSAALNTPAPVQPPVSSSLPVYSSDHNAMAAAQMEAYQSRYSDQPATSSTPAESNLLSTLVDTLSAAATSSSFLATSNSTSRMFPVGQRGECSVKLSYPKAMLPKSTPYEARLFFLCTKTIPNDVLEDAFSTFGDLINVYMISGKNCGYIMYASKRCAEAAVQTLNNATLSGARLKV